jgi:hypothetical protein
MMSEKTLRRVAILGGFLVLGLLTGGLGTYYARSAEPGRSTPGPIHTITRTVEKTYTSTAAAPAPITVTQKPAPPPVEFGDGLYLVGQDIKPGEYKTTGPTPGGSCYWARLTDDAGSDIIANNLTEGPTRLTAVKGEYLEISGCTFVKA